MSVNLFDELGWLPTGFVRVRFLHRSKATNESSRSAATVSNLWYVGWTHNKISEIVFNVNVDDNRCWQICDFFSDLAQLICIITNILDIFGNLTPFNRKLIADWWSFIVILLWSLCSKVALKTPFDPVASLKGNKTASLLHTVTVYVLLQSPMAIFPTVTVLLLLKLTLWVSYNTHVGYQSTNVPNYSQKDQLGWLQRSEG